MHCFSAESSMPYRTVRISPGFYLALLRITQPESTENIRARPGTRGVNPSVHGGAFPGLAAVALPGAAVFQRAPWYLLWWCGLGVKRSLQFQKMPDVLKDAPEEERASLKWCATFEKVGVHAQGPGKLGLGPGIRRRTLLGFLRPSSTYKPSCWNPWQCFRQHVIILQ